jgi:hypothetical protein
MKSTNLPILASTINPDFTRVNMQSDQLRQLPGQPTLWPLNDDLPSRIMANFNTSRNID